MLVALLLPAVNAARESARRTVCQNQIKQLALGALNHEAQHGHLPVAGWHPYQSYKVKLRIWTGDPDKGFGHQQPGGWAFNILPYIEQDVLYGLGSGSTSHDQKALAIKQRVATPVPLFFCPSRREPLVLKGTEDRPATVYVARSYNNLPESVWGETRGGYRVRTHGLCSQRSDYW